MPERRQVGSEPASVAIRIAAAAIDLVAAYAVGFAVAFPLGAAVGFLSPVAGAALATYTPLVVAVSYRFLEVSPSRQTVGKHMVGIELVTTDGQRVSALREAGRLLAGVAVLAMVVPLLWASFRPDQRMLHDHLTGTRVVRSSAFFSLPDWWRGSRSRPPDA